MQNVVANRRLVEDAARVSSTDPPYSCLASRELNARSVALSLHSCVRWVVGSVLAAILLIHGPVACGITAGTWGVLVLSDLAWTNAVHVSTLFVHTFSISLIVDYVMHAMHAPPNSRVISALGHSMITSVLAIMASTSATSRARAMARARAGARAAARPMPRAIARRMARCAGGLQATYAWCGHRWSGFVGERHTQTDKCARCAGLSFL